LVVTRKGAAQAEGLACSAPGGRRRREEVGTVYPVGSEEPVARPPVATLTLIGINVLVFILEVILGDAFVLRWSFTPAAFTAFLNGTGSPEALATVFTSMFMHASVSHLLGNMLFLWVFGQATEDAFGSGPFTLFYLACGVVANFAQYAVAPDSTVPNLGASGAIAGVMGAYLAMYPGSDIDVFAWPLSLFVGRNLRIPAWLLLGVWFAIQLVSGVGTASTADAGGGTGGVAYLAHVGGFLVGFLLALVVQPGRREALADV
jgi:membrane associated rhomboid family serine protease